MAVSGGTLLILCFFANLERMVLRLMSFRGRAGSLAASWSSIRALAMSAQHRRKRSFSGGRFDSFLRLVAVTVVVAIVGKWGCAIAGWRAPCSVVGSSGWIEGAVGIFSVLACRCACRWRSREVAGGRGVAVAGGCRLFRCVKDAESQIDSFGGANPRRAGPASWS